MEAVTQSAGDVINVINVRTNIMLSFRESYIYPPRRFGCKGKNQVKLRTNVLFNMKLNVSPFLSSPEQNSSYSLYAVVVKTSVIQDQIFL